MHIPHLFSAAATLPCPYVMTVHDVLEHMSRARQQTGFWRSLHFQMTQRALRGRRGFSRSRISRAAKWRSCSRFRSSRIEVVYNAIDERFLHGHASDGRPRTDGAALPGQLSVPAVCRASQSAQERGADDRGVLGAESGTGKGKAYPDLKLIIIGDDLSGHPDLRRTVVRSGVQNDVRFMGFVPIEVLRIFYDAAKIFVFPSLYEGFGLPPLEAMAHGTPVVTSNTSSLPEVVGNAAVLVNPENVFEIMRALHRVLMDQALRERMKERGYKQVTRFSWESSVRRVLDAYRQVAEGERVESKSHAAD